MCIKNNVAIKNSLPEGMYVAVTEDVNGDFSAKFGFPTYEKEQGYMGIDKFYNLLELAVNELTGGSYSSIATNGLCVNFTDDCPERVKLASSHSEPLSLIRQGYSLERVKELTGATFTEIEIADIEKEFGYEVFKTTRDVIKAITDNLDLSPSFMYKAQMIPRV